jgi:hypothetical protein
MTLFEHILTCYYLKFISQLVGIMAYELQGDGEIMPFASLLEALVSRGHLL